MGTAQCELGERSWILTRAFTLQEWAAVTSGALPALILWLSLVVEAAICPSPDAALPVLSHMECIVVAG